MTRKDFELIADVLSGHYRNGNEEQKAESSGSRDGADLWRPSPGD